MSKFCQNCGTENDDAATFCKSCGAGLTAPQQPMNNMNQGMQQQPMNNQGMNYMGGQPSMNNYGGATMGPNLVPFRNIVMAIVLSMVTCGIYGLYWFVVMTDDAKKVSNDNQGASGALSVVLILVTCGIYGIYWYYKQGQRLYQAGQLYGVDIKDNSILYLILGLFGLGFVSEILIQTDLNKFSSGK